MSNAETADPQDSVIDAVLAALRDHAQHPRTRRWAAALLAGDGHVGRPAEREPSAACVSAK